MRILKIKRLCANYLCQKGIIDSIYLVAKKFCRNNCAKIMNRDEEELW